MTPSHRLLVPSVLLALALPASADTVSGTIVYHKDVVQIPITISATTDLTLWTDSVAHGGFDPIISLWIGGVLVDYNDDSSPVDPGQAHLDSVLRFQAIAPGSYLLTVTSYNNFPNGSNLSDGFALDASTPVPIDQWWSMGSGTYTVNWTPEFRPFLGGEPPPIPEPSSWTMLLAGLGVAGCAARRRRVHGQTNNVCNFCGECKLSLP